MARIRSIKPEFWESVTVGKCSRSARLLMLGLISHADDAGRQRGDMRLIKGKVFAYDDDLALDEVEIWLQELDDAGLVVIYEVDEQRYVQISNWNEHQRIEKPKDSTIPGPEGAIGDESATPPGSISVGREGKGRDKEEDHNVKIVFERWRDRCHHEKALLSSDRRAKILARLREGRSVDDLCVAIEGAARGAYVNDSGHRFDDIELICRTGAKLESFMARAGASSVGSSASAIVDQLNAAGA